MSDSKMTFSYKGNDRKYELTLTGEDADYLPKAMVTFADFLRGVGFTWVGVEQIDCDDKPFETKNYLFHGNYKSGDYDDWGESWYRERDVDDTEQTEINKAASDYWGKDDKFIQDPDDIDVGDSVYYHGKGTPDPQNEHHGFRGTKLHYSEGTVIKISDSAFGLRVLVKWNNWNDGHSGMGDVTDALVSDKCFWWSNIDNLYKVNDTKF